MSLVWLLPINPLVVSSSTGALLAQALKVDSTAVALFTTSVSLTMVFIGLSLSLMVVVTYFMRLMLHGPPNPMLILSGFICLGPLGQGGFSLLINGQTISELLSVHDASVNLTGQIIHVVCVCAAVVLWSMGVGWFIVSISATVGLLRRHKIPFAITHWGLVYPHGVFALLSVQLGKVLDSLFFRSFGAIGSGE
jgi:tellurite resistance protein TehA-like permease